MCMVEINKVCEKGCWTDNMLNLICTVNHMVLQGINNISLEKCIYIKLEISHESSR
jgi:hypothetical protein